MGLSTQEPTMATGPLLVTYDRQSRLLKDRLYVQRAAWLRATGQSPEQFADRLARISGKRVTAKMVEHWLNPHDHTRQIHGTMLHFWRAAVRLPDEPVFERGDVRCESVVAQALADAREFEVYQYGD